MNKIEGLRLAEKLDSDGMFTGARENISDSMLPKSVCDELARRSHLAPFLAVQSQLPGVPILPVPDYSRLVVATTADYVEDIELVNKELQLVSFSAFTSGVYFVSFAGRCILPLPSTGFSQDFPRDMFVAPTGMTFYGKGISRVSIGIVNSGDVVSVLGWRVLP